MVIEKLHVSGYRSVRDLTLKLGQLNVIVGPNGCGKSNLYRALYLVAAAAGGTLARDLADEGGLPSALWSGKRHKKEDPLIKLGVGFDDLIYELELGRIPLSDRPRDEPKASSRGIIESDDDESEDAEDFEESNRGAAADIGLGAFIHDPDIKMERVLMRAQSGKDVVLVQRQRANLMARNMDGRPVEMPLTVLESESVLSGIREPHKFPELSLLRQKCLSWRFYHKFRTDLRSPIRQPQLGVITPVLSHDGVNLAAALATITAIGDRSYLEESIQKAFPGSEISVEYDLTPDGRPKDGIFRIEMSTEKLKRPFSCLEFSDGTLHYLCLLAALLSPRPAPLVALNEPETSIHPDLFRPLAELIAYSSRHSQIWVTTHSRDLARYICQLEPNTNLIELEKLEGGTKIVGVPLSQIVDEDDKDGRPRLPDEPTRKFRKLKRKS